MSGLSTQELAQAGLFHVRSRAGPAGSLVGIYVPSRLLRRLEPRRLQLGDGPKASHSKPVCRARMLSGFPHRLSLWSVAFRREVERPPSASRPPGCRHSLRARGRALCVLQNGTGCRKLVVPLVTTEPRDGSFPCCVLIPGNFIPLRLFSCPPNEGGDYPVSWVKRDEVPSPVGLCIQSFGFCV